MANPAEISASMDPMAAGTAAKGPRIIELIKIIPSPKLRYPVGIGKEKIYVARNTNAPMRPP